MRESILTIPINEVFEPKDGCPLCRMRDTVEQHICEYIMGAAMMEPDVRAETNELGFCITHFEMLMQQNNRLSLALMLNSYLAGARENIFEKKKTLFGKNAKSKKAAEIGCSCFVCSKVNWGIDHMLETFYVMYVKDEKFRELFRAQQFICIPHYNLLAAKAAVKLQKNDAAAFEKDLGTLVGEYIKQLNADVNDFCNSFDYRNAGSLHKPEMEHVRSSVERSIEFLTSRKPRVK